MEKRKRIAVTPEHGVVCKDSRGRGSIERHGFLEREAYQIRIAASLKHDAAAAPTRCLFASIVASDLGTWEAALRVVVRRGASRGVKFGLTRRSWSGSRSS